MEKLLRVGVISSTHGVRGEVKVYPTTDDLGRFKKLKECILDTGKGYMDLHVQSCKFFKGMAILKFREFNNIDEIMPYRNKDILVTRENAVKLEEDENFICDLIGLDVMTDEGQQLGKLEDVMQTGANDVYIVKTSEGREILLPVIKECVLNIDLEKGQVLVHVLPGLLDL